jgi:hypothetical protein
MVATPTLFFTVAQVDAQKFVLTMFFVRLSDMTGQGPTSWYRVEVVILPLYLYSVLQVLGGFTYKIEIPT